ncbi:hypothetical protein HUJ04_000460 [Dendroctonus ponderosae]|nr:hypothetical protein HUJ04_000460 [Dendroctonus ponderosae]
MNTTIFSSALFIVVLLGVQHQVMARPNLISRVPTSTYDDENIEIFYEAISKAVEEQKTRFTLVIQDFNAKLSKKLSKE